MSILCVERLFLGVADDGSLLKERGIHSVQRACSFAWLMSDLYLQNEAYTVCRALVPWRVDDGFLLQERGIHSVQRPCSFAWLMSDLYLQKQAYTVCSAVVPSRGLCQIFGYRTRHTQCRQLAPSRGLIRIFQFKEQ